MKITFPGHYYEPGGHQCPHSNKCTDDLEEFLRWSSIANWRAGHSLEVHHDVPTGTEATCKHGTQWVVVSGGLGKVWRRVENDPNPPPPRREDWRADPSIEQLEELARRELES